MLACCFILNDLCYKEESSKPYIHAEVYQNYFIRLLFCRRQRQPQHVLVSLFHIQPQLGIYGILHSKYLALMTWEVLAVIFFISPAVNSHLSEKTFIQWVRYACRFWCSCIKTFNSIKAETLEMRSVPGSLPQNPSTKASSPSTLLWVIQFTLWVPCLRNTFYILLYAGTHHRQQTNHFNNEDRGNKSFQNTGTYLPRV